MVLYENDVTNKIAKKKKVQRIDIILLKTRSRFLKILKFLMFITHYTVGYFSIH